MRWPEPQARSSVAVVKGSSEVYVYGCVRPGASLTCRFGLQRRLTLGLSVARERLARPGDGHRCWCGTHHRDLGAVNRCGSVSRRSTRAAITYPQTLWRTRCFCGQRRRRDVDARELRDARFAVDVLSHRASEGRIIAPRGCSGGSRAAPNRRERHRMLASETSNSVPQGGQASRSGFAPPFSPYGVW